MERDSLAGDMFVRPDVAEHSWEMRVCRWIRSNVGFVYLRVLAFSLPFPGQRSESVFASASDENCPAEARRDVQSHVVSGFRSIHKLPRNSVLRCSCFSFRPN